VAFTFTKDVDGPFYLYYEMKNFFQNHRRYYLSYDASQLQGQLLSEGDVSLNCDPLYKNGSLLLNPCGLVASSFFNGKNDRVPVRFSFRGARLTLAPVCLIVVVCRCLPGEHGPDDRPQHQHR
jgi:hypothetical protein